MVWHYGHDSSDSEEERHDKFRSERVASGSVKNKSDVFSSLKAPPRSVGRFRNHSPERHSDRRRRSPVSDKSHLSSIKDGPYDRSRASPKRHDRKGDSSRRRHSTERRPSRETSKLDQSLKRSHFKSEERRDKDNSSESRHLINGDDPKERRSESDRNRKKHKTSDKSHTRPPKNPSSELPFEDKKETSKPKSKNELSPYDKDLITLDTISNSSEGEIDSKTSDDQMFGPALPPKQEATSEQKSEDRKSKKKCKRKALSRKLKEEQAAEERLKSEEVKEIVSSETNEERKLETHGPTASQSQPSEVEKEVRVYGPLRGGGTRTERDEEPEEGEVMEEEDDDDGAYGPALPPKAKAMTTTTAGGGSSRRRRMMDGDDDGGGFGPCLPDAPLTPAQMALNHRAALLKLHMDNKRNESETAKREEWMLELPQKHSAGLGLVSRTFRAKESSAAQDSAWTDTPAEKARKAAMAQVGQSEPVDPKIDHERSLIAQRDKEMERMAKRVNKEKKKEEKSLLQLHQDKLKKKKKEDKDKKPERKPFNRETDMQVNVLTEAQRKAIYKKASNLDSRFSSGQAKYL